MHNASGIGTYIRNIVPFLVDVFDITLLGNNGDIKKYDWSKKVKIINCHSKIYSIEEQIELYRKAPPCDVFWSPHYNIPLLPIRAKKGMVTIHDVYHLAFWHTLSLPQKIYAKFMINQALRRSDVVITVSEFSKREILKYTGTSKDITVIYNGINKNFFTEAMSEEKGNYILYVGNVKPHKNLVRALEAFSLLEAQDLKFKIVGKKENFITADKEVEKVAQKLGDKVEFTGYVSDNELRELYQRARLFLFPSLYEGFGFPPLEAMSCGCPVIVSNAASLPEVCGDAALYCDPYNPADIAVRIKQLLCNEALQAELRKKGTERVKLFSWERCAHETHEAIEGLQS